jgi:hypothetical protein
VVVAVMRCIESASWDGGHIVGGGLNALLVLHRRYCRLLQYGKGLHRSCFHLWCMQYFMAVLFSHVSFVRYLFWELRPHELFLGPVSTSDEYIWYEQAAASIALWRLL